MDSSDEKNFDFFKFDKRDCLELFKEVGELESSEDGLIQMKIEKLNKYRELVNSELQWNCVNDYMDLIREFLTDDINLIGFSKGVVSFSQSIVEKTKSIENCSELLMDNDVVISPSKIGHYFSKFVLEIKELALSYDLNSTEQEKLYLLEKIIYVKELLEQMIDAYIEEDYNPDVWTD